jgi:maleamate amidohydrolase
VTPVGADRLPSGAPEASRRRWELAIPQSDRLILDAVMPIQPAELGKRPALLVVDVTYGFTGTRPLPLSEAISEYPTSCGTGAWDVLPRIRSLIDVFLEQDLPVIWTTGGGNDAAVFGAATTRRRDTDRDGDGNRRHELHEQIMPNGPITVIAKTRASAFFGTPLSALLTRLRVDSIVLTGGTTSGCVRASAVDAFSSGYQAWVVADCCFDRSAISHDVSLFDLSHKYVTVLDSDELLAQLAAGRPADFLDEGAP